MKLSKQPTKELAKQFLAAVEARIRRVLVGIADVQAEETLAELFDEWAATLRKRQPWLDDDNVVRKLIDALPPPFDLIFYVGNQSGLRPGETAGLRMSDLGFLDEGVIRVRFSYDGPLKEDKDGSGKVKWVPAAADARDVLGDWLARREAAGAGPEDLVFPSPKGGTYRKVQIEDAWDGCAAAHVGKRADAVVTRHGRVSDIPKPALTFYQATRHSFVSRNLAKGVALDEVSAAVGHSSPIVTRRFYDHFVRKTFSSEIRTGLGLKKLEKAGAVIPLKAAGRKQEVAYRRATASSSERTKRSLRPIRRHGSDPSAQCSRIAILSPNASTRVVLPLYWPGPIVCSMKSKYGLFVGSPVQAICGLQM